MSFSETATTTPSLLTEYGQELLDRAVEYNPRNDPDWSSMGVAFFVTAFNVDNKPAHAKHEKGWAFSYDTKLRTGAGCHGALLYANPDRRAVISYMIGKQKKFSSIEKEFVEHFVNRSPWSKYLRHVDLSDKKQDSVAIFLADIPSDLTSNLCTASRTSYEYHSNPKSSMTRAFRMCMAEGLSFDHADYLSRFCVLGFDQDAALRNTPPNGAHCPFDQNAIRFLLGQDPKPRCKSFGDAAWVSGKGQRINDMWRVTGEPEFTVPMRTFDSRLSRYIDPEWRENIDQFKEYLENVTPKAGTQGQGSGTRT